MPSQDKISVISSLIAECGSDKNIEEIKSSSASRFGSKQKFTKSRSINSNENLAINNKNP